MGRATLNLAVLNDFGVQRQRQLLVIFAALKTIWKWLALIFGVLLTQDPRKSLWFEISLFTVTAVVPAVITVLSAASTEADPFHALLHGRKPTSKNMLILLARTVLYLQESITQYSVEAKGRVTVSKAGLMTR
jgi:hypothetical protein